MKHTYISSWPFYIVLALVSVTKLWLTSAFAIYGESQAMHDDAHFVYQAETLLSGEWLGPYNQFTLIKGPGFSFWIVLLHLLKTPLLLGQSAFYIILSVCFAFAVKKYSHSQLVATLSFIFLVFYLEIIPRVTREGLYILLTFGIFVTAFWCLYYLTNSKKWFILNLLSLGFFFSLFWITREEGIWILPSLGIMLLFSFYQIYINRTFSIQEKLSRVCGLCLPILIFGLTILLIKLINHHYYQSFNVTDMNDGSFLGAYGRLTRVIPPKHKLLVPVTKDTRNMIYNQSSAFRLLHNQLENSGWSETNCSGGGLQTCGEMTGGKFIWAFRDAVANAGFYQNSEITRKFYKQLRNEIDYGCAIHALECYPKRKTLSPVINRQDIPIIINSFYRGIQYLFLLENLNLKNLAGHFFKTSSGTVEYLDRFKQMIQGEFAPLDSASNLHEYQQQKLFSPQYQVYATLTKIYRAIWPWFLISALLCFCLSCIICILQKTIDRAIIFSFSLLVAIITRIIILAIIDATSFWGINELYMSPIFPLTIVFIIFCPVDFYNRIIRRKFISEAQFNSKASCA